MLYTSTDEDSPTTAIWSPNGLHLTPRIFSTFAWTTKTHISPCCFERFHILISRSLEPEAKTWFIFGWQSIVNILSLWPVHSQINLFFSRVEIVTETPDFLFSCSWNSEMEGNRFSRNAGVRQLHGLVPHSLYFRRFFNIILVLEG